MAQDVESRYERCERYERISADSANNILVDAFRDENLRIRFPIAYANKDNIYGFSFYGFKFHEVNVGRLTLFEFLDDYEIFLRNKLRIKQ